MPKHCAALPGASNELLGGSTAELATALLERFGAIPTPRDGGPRRHAVVTPAPPPYAPKQRLKRTGLPSRPVLAAMSVTAVGAVAAVAATATGQFASLAPAANASANAAMTLPGTLPGALPDDATAAPLAPAPPVTSTVAAALHTVQVSHIVDDATSTARTLAAKAAADQQAAAAKAAAAKVAAAKATADQAAAKAKAKASDTASTVTTAVAGSGAGARALAIAETKIGKPYVWGAAGPNAFDCSGLVMWAFKQIGISLPRTSAAQSQAGTAVSKSDLRPGDLVFFYSPVSHVGIYMGNGQILHASHSGVPVKISSMQYMPFHNARRI